jgi:tripartite-type tricarboxylate transporter receptor subunit TctC
MAFHPYFRLRDLCVVLAMTAGLILPGTSLRAEGYPNRPVTIVVPYAPGGGTDILARILAQQLKERWDKPVIVENRSGAGTAIAARAVAKAAPDGHTLLMATSSTLAINPALYRKLTYDPAEFTPIGLICTVPFVLVANAHLPIKSVPELIAYAKEVPSQLDYASAGVGSPHHLFMALFESMTGTHLSHIVYRGSVPALTDVMAGHVPLMFSDLATALPLIADGRIKAIGLSARTRAAAAPDIEPLADNGVPGYDASAWQMLMAPANTPASIVAKLNADVNAILRIPEVAQKLVTLGFIPLGEGEPAELQQFVSTEAGRWAGIVQQAGIAGTQ